MLHSSNDVTEFNHSWAFVIGINQYTNGIAPLQTAVNDAKAFAQLLELEHGYQVQLLLDQSADLSQLIHLLQKTLPIEVKSDDRVLFYFAGHGVALDAEDGPAGYLIPQDAYPNNTSTFLSMRELHEALTALPCRHLLAILDCCFSGAFRWSSLRDVIVYSEVIHQERYDRFIHDPAWQAITSTAYDQEALDILQDTRGQVATNHHSPFAKALFDALQGGADLFPPSEKGRPAGDGVITATELYLYLRNRVEQSTQGHHRRQTPGLWPLRKHDKGEYIFLVPGHELNLPPAPTLNRENNPYRGLEAFEQDHAKLFFGRNQLIQELQTFVAVHSLTVVLGASGTGKSSLVKAGLIPQLQDSVKPEWQILSVTRPGESPLKALAKTVLSLSKADSVVPKNELLSDVFVQAPENIARIIAEWNQHYPEKQLLIVIDQFEELITLCRSDSERKTFLELLRTILSSATFQGRVVLTLRSDFEPQFLDSPLKPFWENARFIVPPMTQDELRQAIEGPAAERVLYFEPPSLVDQLINEVVQMPGALPLLSFTLSELYIKYLERRSDNRSLTQEDYQTLGGVAGSLTQRATQEYQQLVQQDGTYAETIKRLMLRMVAIEGGELTRRRVPLSELIYSDPMENKRVDSAIQQLIMARLVVKGRDPEGEPYVEPAHDALVQGWDKLQQWRNEEPENLILQRLLTPAARAWKDNQHNARDLWTTNSRLERLQETYKSKNNWLNRLETEFVERSLWHRRKNRVVRGLAIAVSVVGLSIIGIIGTEAQRRGIENLTASSEANLRAHNELDAVLTSIEAGQQTEDINKSFNGFLQRIIQPDAWAATDFKATTTLHQALFQLHQQNQLEGHSARVNKVIFSSQCSKGNPLIASASDDGSIKLWSLTGALENTFEHDSNARQPVTSVSFSPDCQLLITGGYDGKVKVWKLDWKSDWKLNGTLIKELADDSLVTDVQFSPNGQQFVTVHYGSAAGGQIKLWNRQGKLVRIFEAKTHEFSRIRFNADGTMLALAGRDNIKLWNLDGRLIQTFDAHNAPIRSVSFNKSSTLLASASNNGTIEIWRLDGKRLYTHQNAHRGTVNDISFSPNDQAEQLIASVGEDTTVKLWHLVDQQSENGNTKNGNIDLKPVATFEGHREAVTSLSFNPDGKTLATASQDNTVRLWNLDENLKNSVVRILGNNSLNRKAVFSPDKESLALLRNDGKIDLWNLSSGEKNLFGAPDEYTLGISFSPDGKTIASISRDNATITLRDFKGKLVKTLRDSALETKEGFLTRIDFSADGKTIAVADSDDMIKLWNLDKASFITLNPKADSVNCLKFSPDGKILAIASEEITEETTAANSTIQLWNLEGQLLERLEGYSQFDQTLQFSPDGKSLAFLASKNDQQTILLWNFGIWKFVNYQLLPLKGHAQPVTSINFSRDGKMIASTSRDHTVRLWRNTGQIIRTLIGHNDWVDGVIFYPNGRVLASFSNITNETSSVDSEIKLWGIDGREISTLNSFGSSMLSVVFSENDKLIAADELGNNSVTTWNLDRNDLLKLGCQQLSNYLQYNENVQTKDRDMCEKYM